MHNPIDVKQVNQALKQFVEKRNFGKVHNAKNLTTALIIEVAELLEPFQWMTEQEALNAHNNPRLKTHTSHELADVVMYAIQIADMMGIDLHTAIQEKLKINEEKYPADKA